MADEITQVVEMEFKGIYYLIGGTKTAIAETAQAIKAIAEWRHERWLNKPGSSEWTKIQEASEGMAPILEFPKEMFEETVKSGKKYISPFEDYCKKNGLRYCVLPDLDPNDGYIPVAVLSQDMGMHQEQIKKYMKLKIQEEEDKSREYDKAIDEAGEKKANAKTDAEKTQAENEENALKQAKKDNEKQLAISKEKDEKGNEITFEEYLKQGENTKIMENAERTLSDGENLIVPEFHLTDCMYPIRDAALKPESGEIYYSQKGIDEKIHTIKRTFETDQNGLLVSTYEISNIENQGTHLFISDEGITKEEWLKKLPELLSGSGFLMDSPTAVSHSESRIAAYYRSAEANFTPAPGRTFSSEEAKEFVTDMAENEARRKAVEDMNHTVITTDATDIVIKDSTLYLHTDMGFVQGIEAERVGEETADVVIFLDRDYHVMQKDKILTMAGSDVADLLERGAEAEAHERARMAAVAR